VHAARRGLKARVFRRGQLAGRDSRRPGGETSSPVLYPFPYQIWFDWDVFAIGFPGASRCMHAAMVDETGVAPRNQQRSGRGGHAGAAAGNPESSDEGIRVAPRKTAPHCLGSRLLMLRGAARQGVAAAGIRLRTLFCRSVELGIGLVARPRSTHKKPRVETREHAAREPAASCRGSLGGPPPAWNQPGPPGLARTQEAPGGNPGACCTRTRGVVPRFAWRAAARLESTRPSGPGTHTRSPGWKPGDSGSEHHPAVHAG